MQLVDIKIVPLLINKTRKWTETDLAQLGLECGTCCSFIASATCTRNATRIMQNARQCT